MLPEKLYPGGRVYAMASTGEVEKRFWVATSVSKNFLVSYWLCKPWLEGIYNVPPAVKEVYLDVVLRDIST